MPPKKSAAAAPKKAAAAAPAHASYVDMVKERNGSSRQAIQKYIKANNKLGNVTEPMFKSLVNRAIASGEKNGVFSRPKGASGTVKLAKKDAKEPKPAAAKKAEPKAEKKAKPLTKAPAQKKAAAKPKAEAKTKAAPKKAAAKPKANAGKPRKTTAAPAVDKEVSHVLGKTKSGRVTKTKAPPAAKPAAKKAAPKKATPKKTAAKKATPKKATPKKSEA